MSALEVLASPPYQSSRAALRSCLEHDLKAVLAKDKSSALVHGAAFGVHVSCTIFVEQNAEGQLRIFCTSEGCCKRPWKGRDEGDTARSSRPQGTPP